MVRFAICNFVIYLQWAYGPWGFIVICGRVPFKKNLHIILLWATIVGDCSIFMFYAEHHTNFLEARVVWLCSYHYDHCSARKQFNCGTNVHCAFCLTWLHRYRTHFGNFLIRFLALKSLEFEMIQCIAIRTINRWNMELQMRRRPYRSGAVGARVLNVNVTHHRVVLDGNLTISNARN